MEGTNVDSPFPCSGKEEHPEVLDELWGLHLPHELEVALDQVRVPFFSEPVVVQGVVLRGFFSGRGDVASNVSAVMSS